MRNALSNGAIGAGSAFGGRAGTSPKAQSQAVSLCPGLLAQQMSRIEHFY
jgi:hypothetical protein